MLRIHDKSRFRKDYKKLKSSNKDLRKLANTINKLAAQQPLPVNLRDHALTGEYTGCRECHIAPDWLLIYQTTDSELILLRTGSHSGLFG